MSIKLLLCLLVFAQARHIQFSLRSGEVKPRGVNLGGWLVVEQWMTSSSPIWQGVPESVYSKGEFITMLYLGHEVGDQRFKQHRDEWITEEDIIEIADQGLNLVRVPVGYWIAGFDKTGGLEYTVFAPGALDYLDRLIRIWAKRHNVAVLISIHAAKGSQNGHDHSAPSEGGQSRWADDARNVQNTIDLAAFLADRYRLDEAFLGIGLLNEPEGTTDAETLTDFYYKAYARIRNTGNFCILTHAPLMSQQDPQHFADLTPNPKYVNVWHEWHKYLIWGFEDKTEETIFSEAIPFIENQMKTWTGNPLFIGEWSLATTDRAPFADDAKFL